MIARADTDIGRNPFGRFRGCGYVYSVKSQWTPSSVMIMSAFILWDSFPEISLSNRPLASVVAIACEFLRRARRVAISFTSLSVWSSTRKHCAGLRLITTSTRISITFFRFSRPCCRDINCAGKAQVPCSRSPGLRILSLLGGLRIAF